MNNLSYKYLPCSPKNEFITIDIPTINNGTRKLVKYRIVSELKNGNKIVVIRRNDIIKSIISLFLTVLMPGALSCLIYFYYYSGYVPFEQIIYGFSLGWFLFDIILSWLIGHNFTYDDETDMINLISYKENWITKCAIMCGLDSKKHELIISSL